MEEGGSSLEKELSEEVNKGSEERDSDEKSDKRTKRKSKKEIKEKGSDRKEIIVSKRPRMASGFNWKEIGFSLGWSLDSDETPDAEDESEDREEGQRTNMARNLEENLEGIAPLNMEESGDQDRYNPMDSNYISGSYDSSQENREKSTRVQQIHESYSMKASDISKVQDSRERFQDPDLVSRQGGSTLERDYVINRETGQLQTHDVRGDRLRSLKRDEEGMYEIN